MGRPPVENRKVHITLRLASDVVDGIRATGPGYNARVEKVLRDSLARGELNSRPHLTTAAGDELSASHLARYGEHITERLRQLDTERTQLADQIKELETAKRVVLRLEGTTQAAAPTQSGRRRRTTAATGSNRGLPSLGDQILALATGKTRQEIAAACKGARPNHISMALARHKRAGRIEERDGKLSAAPSAETMQRATT